MHAFITGATGFLGKHVVKQLAAQNWHITALCRDMRKTLDYPVEGIDWKQGQVQNIQSLRHAVPHSVDAIFHLAADTTTWSPQHRRQYQTNVTGTKNMVKVAMEKQAIRFIHTSSIAVYGFHDGEVDEFSEMRGIDSPIAYYRTKYLAEEVIREHIRKGLDAVILNPASIVGAYDEQNWIRLFDSIYNDQLPGIPPGSKSFCYVEDVAKAHIQAFIHGRCGENYIISGPNADLLDVCQLISDRLNKTTFHHTMPGWAFKTVGYMLSLISLFTRKEPAISSEQAQIVCAKMQANCEKAQRELQYHSSKTLEEMIDITYQWWLERNCTAHSTQHPPHSRRLDVA